MSADTRTLSFDEIATHSHNIATQRLSRWGSPAARARWLLGLMAQLKKPRNGDVVTGQTVNCGLLGPIKAGRSRVNA
jgi:hypothetical protein